MTKTKSASGAGRKIVPASETAIKAAPNSAAKRATPIVKRVPKRETILALVCRSEGATLAELMAATSWQPHSVRSLICGLRKAGFSITLEGRAPDSPYRAAEQG